MHVHIHTHTHTHTRTHTHMHVHIHTHTHTHTHTHIHTHIHMHAHIDVYIHTHTQTSKGTILVEEWTKSGLPGAVGGKLFNNGSWNESLHSWWCVIQLSDQPTNQSVHQTAYDTHQSVSSQSANHQESPSINLFSSVQSLNRSGLLERKGGNMRDDSAELLFQSFLHEALVSTFVPDPWE